MLSELFIENVAVIEKAEIRFSAGLNVLTGETGAGKSILIDSINAILGNRTTREIVRTGSDKSVIWATFTDIGEETKEAVKSLGYDGEEETLVLYREISADGGTRCRINQRPATVSAVRELCENLINIHGQHDNQDLLNPDRHIVVLDRFAGLETDVTEYRSLYKKTSDIKQRLENLNIDDAQKERQMDLLRYQIDEIEKAELYVGEDDELNAQRNAIRNSERILEALNNASFLFSGDEEVPGIVTSIYDAMNTLEGISELNEEYASLYSGLSEQYYTLTELSGRIGDTLSSFAYDPSQLHQIEERLDLIFRLKRKYGETTDDILTFLETSKKELETIETSDVQREELQKEYDSLYRELLDEAKALSEKRKNAFRRFEEKIKNELAYLNMAGALFVVRHEIISLGGLGCDKIEFYLSTNPGEPPKPMSRIASGGELSRIMLAIKNAMAERDSIDTLIFDEIDTGVSGNSAYKIGKKLKESAKSRQTICVTHSAQIASFADNHLLIEKDVHDGRTYTSVHPLDYEARKGELARIISGDNITETSLNNAAEMMEAAREDSI